MGGAGAAGVPAAGVHGARLLPPSHAQVVLVGGGGALGALRRLLRHPGRGRTARIQGEYSGIPMSFASLDICIRRNFKHKNLMDGFYFSYNIKVHSDIGIRWIFASNLMGPK